MSRASYRVVRVLCAALTLGWFSAAHTAVPDHQILLVEVGTHKLMREHSQVSRVAVGDPSIADVSVVNLRELLITGRKQGVTSLHVWPKNGTAREYRVRVGPIQDPTARAVPDEDLAMAKIRQGQSLAGRLPNLPAHHRARQAAGADAVDTSQVELETQVMTEIRIAEVSRSTMKQFGINLLKSVGNTLAGLSPPGALSGVNASGSPFAPFASGSGFLPVQSAYNIVVGDPSRGVLGVLSLLENKGLARTLAEPSLVAMSGQTASFLAGGEFPVPVNQSGASGGGITIQYKEFGVRLNLTPTVLARDRIGLKVAPEVSDLDFSAGIQVGGVAVPALTVRRTDTSVELGNGESFVISGLVSNNLLANVDKVPWLGSIPVLGAFFRSAQYSREEKELVMVVTPHLVRPMRPEARTPPLPGAETDDYRPGFTRFSLTESGNFENSDAFGFSR